jgi:hypothetical protein
VHASIAYGFEHIRQTFVFREHVGKFEPLGLHNEFQAGDKRGHIGKPLLGVAGTRAHDDFTDALAQFCGQTGLWIGHEWFGRLVQVVDDEVIHRIKKRRPTGQAFVKNGTENKQVGTGMWGDFTEQQFGRSVHQFVRRQSVVQTRRNASQVIQAVLDQNDFAGQTGFGTWANQKNVLGTQIAVNRASFVKRIQGFANVDGQSQRSFDRKGAAF